MKMRQDPPSAARWEALQALFHAASDQPLEAREAFVHGATDDEELARQVLEMVAHADTTFGLHADVAGVAHDRDTPRDRSGERVGPYRLHSRVRFGGMAEVYEAARDDGAFERTVALKIIRGDRPGARLSSLFHRERGRLARLEHPNIAFVFDGGDTEHGEPYFVMELLLGMPFVDACQSERLEWVDVLRHILDLCAAVSHAHQHLIIHRDIKPENVMLADTPAGGQVKLLDFGIAEALPADGETGSEPADVWYSPRFAAPEVTRGERGTQATDVYSLGKLLGLLIAGCPAHQRDEFAAILAHACNTDATQRYATVEALAADLRRLRDHAPISLWRDRRLYVGRRLVRRHAWALAAGLTALALAGGAIHYERTLRLAAEDAAVVAARERDKSNAIRDFLLAGYDSADPANSRGEDVRVVDLLDQHSESLRGDSELGREVRLDLLRVIGHAQLSLGRLDQADLTHQAILDFTSSGTDDTLRFFAVVLLGQSAKNRDQLERAENYYATAEAMLASMPAQTPEAVQATISFTQSWAATLHRQGRFDDAERVIRRGLAAADNAADDQKTASSRLHMLVTLGAIQSARGDLLQAHETFLHGYRLVHSRELAFTFGHLGVLGWLGITFDKMGDSQSSEPYLREAIEVAEKLFPEPNHRLSDAYGNLGAYLLFNGRLGEADLWLQRGLAVLEAMGDTRSRAYQSRIHNLGALALEREDFDAAERYLGESLRLRIETLGESHAMTGHAQSSLASLALVREDWSEAERLAAQAITTLDTASRGGHASLPIAMYTRALALAELGRRQDATIEADRANAWVETQRPDHAAFAAANAMFRARLALTLGDLEEAGRRSAESETLWRGPRLDQALAAARAHLLKLRIERMRGTSLGAAMIADLGRAAGMFETELHAAGPTREMVKALQEEYARER